MPSFDEVYTLIGDTQLGEGGFGIVWRCVLRSDPEGPVHAVKAIPKSRLTDHDKVNLFGGEKRQGEIELHKSLKHPNIVELTSVFDEKDAVSLVMEVCQGGDFHDFVNAQKRNGAVGLAEIAVQAALRDLLAALSFLEERRVVHRDVKPANLLLSSADCPIEDNGFKLCDFGMARVCAPGSMLNERCGSYDVVAPEVARGRPYNMSSDMWSAGVTMFMALSGSWPFQAANDALLLRKVKAGSYSAKGGAWDCVSEEAHDLLSQLMEVDVACRLCADDALDHDWFKKSRDELPWMGR